MPSLATAKAAALLVSALGVPASGVTFDSVTPIDWGTPAIGCPEPGRVYAQVAVPGWMIILRYGDKLYEYHADREGATVVSCDPKLVKTYGNVNPAVDMVLGSAQKVEVLVTGADSATPETAVTIDRPEDVAKIVASLDVELPLYDAKSCSTILEVRFVIGGRVETLEYACSGDGSVMRGPGTAFDGREARSPEGFQNLINKALADRPFPPTPTD